MEEVNANDTAQKIYDLEHVIQRYDWDCGISCILMILSSSQREWFLMHFDKICRDENISKSTWTIDLSYLLKRFEIKHEYYTKYIGVDPKYSNNAYYSRIIEIDRLRVNSKFEKALAKGIVVKEKTVPMQTLIDHLAKHGPIILLINAAKLKCHICKTEVAQKIRYTGHYIVLSGFKMDVKRIYYHNPEVKDGHICECSFEEMDVARQSYGTDEDTLLIFKDQFSE